MPGPLYTQAKRDANEPAIRKVVEARGATFQPVSIKDGPDAFVGYCGLTEPWEIKSGTKRCKPGQLAWAAKWRGRPVQVVRNEAQALKCLRVMEMDANPRDRGGGPDAAVEDAERRTG